MFISLNIFMFYLLKTLYTCEATTSVVHFVMINKRYQSLVNSGERRYAQSELNLHPNSNQIYFMMLHVILKLPLL